MMRGYERLNKDMCFKIKNDDNLWRTVLLQRNSRLDVRKHILSGIHNYWNGLVEIHFSTILVADIFSVAIRPSVPAYCLPVWRPTSNPPQRACLLPTRLKADVQSAPACLPTAYPSEGRCPIRPSVPAYCLPVWRPMSNPPQRAYRLPVWRPTSNPPQRACLPPTRLKADVQSAPACLPPTRLKADVQSAPAYLPTAYPSEGRCPIRPSVPAYCLPVWRPMSNPPQRACLLPTRLKADVQSAPACLPTAYPSEGRCPIRPSLPAYCLPVWRPMSNPPQRACLLPTRLKADVQSAPACLPTAYPSEGRCPIRPSLPTAYPSEGRCPIDRDRHALSAALHISSGYQRHHPGSSMVGVRCYV